LTGLDSLAYVVSMRRRLIASALALGAAITAWPAGLHAMNAAEMARRQAVVAHIGSTVITVAELEDRLAAVPRFQLKAFGDTPDAIRRKFFDQVILPEVLYALEADKLHLDAELPTSSKLLRTESGATTKAIVDGIRPAMMIPLDEIRRYYDANKNKYDTPERLYLFRILCATRRAAEEVLELAQKQPTLEMFTKLAHEMSIDKATAMRAGNLGYLTPEGVSSEAGLSVDPAVVKAAAAVKDGEMVPAPVPEKTAAGAMAFAVVWRRGTIPANHRTVEQAAMQIREAIWKDEADALAKKHLAELRAKHLTELNESLLNGIEITPNEGDVVTHRRPGEVAPLTQVGRSIPRPAN
jgi:peptidyl-prolyl cis-trans isomerase C